MQPLLWFYDFTGKICGPWNFSGGSFLFMVEKGIQKITFHSDKFIFS
jgi:hypothetical protein